jgi:hypothetical protein
MVKLSIPLIITNDETFPRTPWHCVMAVGIDGSYSTVHSKDVRDTHNLIYHKGQPYYHREKSPLWDDWDQNIIFEPEFPNNLRVYPNESTNKRTLSADQMEKLRSLSQNYIGKILVYGFTNSEEVFLPPSPCQAGASIFERTESQLSQVVTASQDQDTSKYSQKDALFDIPLHHPTSPGSSARFPAPDLRNSVMKAAESEPKMKVTPAQEIKTLLLAASDESSKAKYSFMKTTARRQSATKFQNQAVPEKSGVAPKLAEFVPPRDEIGYNVDTHARKVIRYIGSFHATS